MDWSETEGIRFVVIFFYYQSRSMVRWSMSLKKRSVNKICAKCEENSKRFLKKICVL